MIKELLAKNYERAVMDYTAALDEMLEITDGYWVSDEPGGIYCFGDYYAISMEDLKLAVDKSVPFDEYAKFTEYNMKAEEYSFNTINFKSWLKGAPRVDRATFERLDSLKNDMEILVNQEKESLKGRAADL